MPKAKHKPWTSAKVRVRAKLLRENPPLWKTKGPFPFSKLPAEIQNMILHFALDSTSELTHLKDPANHHPLNYDKAIAYPILTANHQLSAQALPIFYANNTFRIVINPNHEHFALEEENLPAWILDPAPHHRAYIRKIHIEVVSNYSLLGRSFERFIHFISEALKNFSSLTSLKVEVIHWIYGVTPKCVGKVRDLFAGVQPAAEITSREMRPDWSAWERIKYNPTYAEPENMLREKLGWSRVFDGQLRCIYDVYHC